jgi:ankyrin repeat protein
VEIEVAVRHLLDGDFSFLEPQFRSSPAGIPVLRWHEEGSFNAHAEALAEALTCACFLGAQDVIDYLLASGVHPDGGNRTGMTALHWAANRAQVDAVESLLRAGASLEKTNRFGGTVLSCAVWSLFNEPRAGQREIIARLLKAGADPDAVPARTGDAEVDELLGRYRNAR